MFTDRVVESLRRLVATAKGGSVVESDLVRLWGEYLTEK